MPSGDIILDDEDIIIDVGETIEIKDENIIPEEQIIANEKDQSEDLFNEIMKSAFSSPGRPNMYSTPSSCRHFTNKSEAFIRKISSFESMPFYVLFIQIIVQNMDNKIRT